MKETFYFSHDYSCTTEPKIQALIGKYGAKGYGLFWRIVEMLHEEPSHRLNMKPYVYEAIAKLFKEDLKEIKDIIEYMVVTCESFTKEKNEIYSDRVLQNLDKRDRIRKARSEAGKRSAEVRSTKAKQNPTKESKVKESKLENIVWSDLLKYFNTCFKKNHKVVNSGVKTKFTARIKEGYTLVNIRQAMQKASNDNFHRDNGYKYCTLEYFSRSNTLDKYGYFNKSVYVPTK